MRRLRRSTAVVAALIAARMLMTAPVSSSTAFATDYYWDRNGTTIYGDAGGSWQSTTSPTNNANWSTSASGTVATVSWSTAFGTRSVQFGFGPAPTNTGTAGIVQIGNSTNPTTGNVAVGTIFVQASGTGGYTFRSPTGNAGSTLTLNTGGADVPAGYGIIVGANVTGTTQFVPTSASSAMKMALGASQKWQNNSTDFPLVVTAAVSGSAALTTEGPGVIVLGTANTFTGGVTVSSGTLQVTHPTALSTGATTVAAAGTLDVRTGLAKDVSGAGSVAVGPGASLTSTTLPGGGLSIAGDALASGSFSTVTATPFSLSSVTLGGFTSVSMPVSSGLLASGSAGIAGTGNQLLLSGVARAGTTYTLLQGSSLTNAGDITLGGVAIGNQTLTLGSTGTIGRTEYTFQSTPTALQLLVTGTQLTLTWTGAVDNVWNESTANWTAGSGATNFYAGDNAVIASAAAITVRPEGVVADGLTVSNASGVASLAGGGVAATTLTKSDAGSFEIDNAVTATTMTVSSGSVTVTGAGTLAVSGTLATSARVAFAGTADQTLSGAVSGTGTLAALGSGSVSIASASPNWTGRFETGVGSTMALVGNATVGAGGTFSGVIATEGTFAIATSSDQTLAGPISGGGSLRKSGASTLVVSGNNTYSGATTVSGGRLRMASPTALGDAAGDTTVQSGAVLDLNGQTVAGESLSLYGTGIATSGALINSSTTAAATWGGPVNLFSAQTGVGGAGNTTLAGNVSGAGGFYKYGEGQVTLAGTNSYSGTLYITTGTVRVMSQAALPATDLQWFQSNSSAGLDLVAPGDYPMASINSFGSMLRVGTTGTGSVSLTVAGGSVLTGNADKKMQVNPRTTVVLNGDVTAGGSTVNRSIIFYPGGDVVINGMVTGGGTGAADNFGILITSNTTGQNGGTVSLNNSNFYTGQTVVNAGTLKLGNALALGDTFKGVSIGAVAVTDTTTGITTPWSQGTVDVNGYSVSDESLTMTGSAGRVSLINSNASTPATWGGTANAVTLSGTAAMGGAGDLTMDRPVSGSGVFAKTGAGTLTLTAGNGYAGRVAVEQGRLALGPAGSVAVATAVTVHPNAVFDVTAPGGYAVPATQTLGGSGTVAGSVTVGSGATLSPGMSPGALTLTGSLTWNSGGNYNWQMLSATGTAGSTSAWDLVNVGGVLAIASTSADPFRINLWTLSGIAPDVSGSAANFSAASSSSWRIATAAGGITGFAADKFTVVTSAANGTGGFANAFGTGTFSVAQSGNDLNLVFTAGTPTVTTINVPSGTQTQTQAGYPTLSGSVPVVKTGAGTLVLDQANTLSGSTTVQGGVLQLANGSALSASRLVVVAGGTGQVAPVTTTSVASLDLASGNGLLDLTRGALTISSGMTATELVAEILEGRGDGSWTGTSGITSSTAAAESAAGTPRAVGWIDNGDGSLTTAYAAPGDTNIDWSIDILDAANFLSGGKFDTGSPAIWFEGDFSYDGVVDILDAADFFATGLYDAGTYNTAPGLSGGIAAVPEPSGLAGIAMAVATAVGAVARRKRRDLRA
jgi:fibronectin-binding autotransporter adhesin